MALLELIARRTVNGLQPVVDELNEQLVPPAITRYNSEFSPRYFGRPPSETVPTARRLLTTFRTRLGALIEYGVAVVIDGFLQDDYGDVLRLAFAVAHEYPDFFMRDGAGDVSLRIDAKALHDESDEYSARFELPVTQIDPTSDLLLYLAWQWRTIEFAGHDLVYPHLLEGLVVPAIDIAVERDRRLIITGGTLDADGVPRIASGNRDTNYGKINRIVHQSRRSSHDLTSNVRAFLEFTERHAEAVERASSTTPSEPRPTPDELAPPPA